MAITGNTRWEIRTTGSTANGGGFDAAFNGTDYSQQASPQLTVTDGSTNTGNTTLTSVTGGFTSQMVGNVLTITQSATFRGFWQIVAWVSGNQVTLDRNGPVTAADCTINVGGALKLTNTGLPPVLNTTSAIVPGQIFWVQAGTYTLTTNDLNIGASATNGTATNPVIIEGYNTVRGDISTDPGLQRPVIAAGGALYPLLFSGTNWIARCLELDGTGTIQAAVAFDTGSVNCLLENCVLNAGASSRGVNIAGTKNTVRRNWIKAGATASDGVFITGTAPHTVERNHIQCTAGNTFTGIVLDVSGTVRENIIRNFTYGVICATATPVHVDLDSNIFYKNVNGLYFNNAAEGPMTVAARRNIFAGNTTYDIRHNTADYSVLATYPNNDAAMEAQFDCNAFYTVGTRYSQLSPGTGDIVLTADPFTDGDSGDFSLNGAPGGGALVRTSACTVLFADGVNSGSFLPGISGNAGSESDTGTTAMRSLWREYTGELSAEISDDVVDIYLQAGLEALNRRVHYHYTTSESAVTLLAEQQEYTLPTDCIEVLWVYLNGSKLQKRDVEDWDKREEQWREEPSGTPVEYAHEGNRIIFRPKPNAAAVAADSTPSIRYISTPPSITTYGPEQVQTQDYRIIVAKGVADWSHAHPDAALAVQRAAAFDAMFEKEASGIAEEYRNRSLAR